MAHSLESHRDDQDQFHSADEESDEYDSPDETVHESCPVSSPCIQTPKQRSAAVNTTAMPSTSQHDTRPVGVDENSFVECGMTPDEVIKEESPRTQCGDVGDCKHSCELHTGAKDPEVLLAEAEDLKAKGNSLFKQGQHAEAIDQYNCALDIAPADARERSIYLANMAACHMALAEYKPCVECCTSALKINPQYLKALRRRMLAHEKLDHLDQALTDAKKVVELNPTDSECKCNIAKWSPIVAQRQEKMKEEVMGKLKDLGNNLLGKFGMSLDNFKFDQDPSTGGYNIRFEQ